MGAKPMVRRLVVALAVAVVVVVLPRAHAGDAASADDDAPYRCHPRTTQITMPRSADVDARELLTWATAFTCQRFVLDPRILRRERVTVIAPDTLTIPQAYRLFAGALAALDLRVVQKGNLLRIAAAPSPWRHHAALNGAGIQRYVIWPDYLAPSTLAPALRKHLARVGEVRLVGATVIIRDPVLDGPTVRATVNRFDRIDRR